MSYLDRLSTASYTAPSGSVHTFAYSDLTRKVAHRIGAFEFSGINGTLHQDKGVSGEVYPLRVIFHGENYDQQADAFFEALKETGRGTLKSPRWGSRKVQVISGPDQAEGFVSKMGESAFDIEFQESLDREFPESTSARQFEIPSDVGVFKDVFGFSVILDSLGDKNALKDAMSAAVGWVRDSLGGIAAPDQDTDAGFLSIITELESNIGSYPDSPGDFSALMFEAVGLPARMPGLIGQKLRAYNRLLASVTVQKQPRRTRSGRNTLLVREVVGSGAVLGTAESINSALMNTSRITRKVDGRTSITVPAETDGFRTRAEVLSAAVLLRDAAGSLVDYLDAGQLVFRPASLSETYLQALANFNPLVAITAKVIQSALSLSFTLPSERVKVLPAESTLINECFELYGNIDDSTLDYFILTNRLAGDKLLELPRGERVVYYV